MSRSMRSSFSFQSSRPVFSKARLAATNSNVFLIRERQLKPYDLILPVYYVNCAVLNDGCKAR